MAIIKQYITWQPVWHKTRNYGSDRATVIASTISDNINNNWDYSGTEITCTELPYGNVSSDKRLLAVIQYDTTNYDADALKRMWDSLKPFVPTKITAQVALDYCNTWHSPPVGKEFTLDTDSFKIVDNRVAK